MAHHKRRRRRRGNIKGCCGMCCLYTTDGRRNGRVMSHQENRAGGPERFDVEERLADWDDLRSQEYPECDDFWECDDPQCGICRPPPRTPRRASRSS